LGGLLGYNNNHQKLKKKKKNLKEKKKKQKVKHDRQTRTGWIKICRGNASAKYKTHIATAAHFCL